PDKCPAADEENISGINRREFLVRMLPTALRRNIGDRALEDLQERLLYTLTGHIARDGRILILAANLVDLVDVDNPLLALLNVSIGRLQQLQDDVLDVLTDIPCFRQRCRIDDRKRHVQHLRQRLRHQGLARPRRTDQQDIRLRQLNFGVPHPVHVDALGMVVNGDRELSLGRLLPDDILIEEILDLERFRNLLRAGGSRFRLIVLQNRIADGDALIANVRPRVVARRRNQLPDHVLTFMAEGTSKSVVRSSALQSGFLLMANSCLTGRTSNSLSPAGPVRATDCDNCGFVWSTAGVQLARLTFSTSSARTN